MANADFTIADVLAWARTKPAHSKYDYQHCANCALAQFLGETGRAERPYVEVFGWRDAGASVHPRLHPISKELADALAPKSRLVGTFGALSRRLEKLVSA